MATVVATGTGNFSDVPFCLSGQILGVCALLNRVAAVCVQQRWNSRVLLGFQNKWKNMYNIRKLSIIRIKFLQSHVFTLKTRLSVEPECLDRAYWWPLVRLELELLACSFLGLAAGALQPFERKPYQPYLLAPLVLRGEPALGAARPLGTLPAWGLAVTGCSCPPSPALQGLRSGVSSRALTDRALWGALRDQPSTAMASGPRHGPCLELNPQVGLSCCPASFSQCLAVLLVFHSPLACMDFLHAPSPFLIIHVLTAPVI